MIRRSVVCHLKKNLFRRYHKFPQTKPRLDGPALAGLDTRPGQSPHEAGYLAWLGLAYFGLALAGSRPQAGPGKTLAAQDEIKLYLDAHYVSSCEANWRLYFFEVQDHEPSVLRLQVHLPNQHQVILNTIRDADLRNALQHHENRETTLTGWFKANALHQDGTINNTLYQDFPNKMVWNKDRLVWTLRHRDFQIGRMYYAHPSSGERFYLRLLLTVVKGATSFEDLRTFQGVLHPTFREACIAQGLLEDDNKWHQCLEEAKHMAVGRQMCHLFVTILKDCTLANPRALWDTFWQDICDDLKRHPIFRNRDPEPTEEKIHDYGLYLIDQLLSQSGKRLQDWDSMPQVIGDWGAALQNLNPLILEQRDYNMQILLTSIFRNSMLISTLPLTRSYLPLPTQQERPFSCIVLKAQARPSFKISFATICTHKARLFFVLPPLALQLFFSRVVILHIPASRSLFPAMRPHSVTSQKTLNLQI